MDNEQAMNEARRRWGKDGFAYQNGHPMWGGPWFCVGYRETAQYGPFGPIRCFNHPDSWEAAFALATK